MNSLNNQNHKEQFDIYELMITPPNKKAEMIISEVVKDNPDISLIKTLIHIGANVDWPDESGRTPLHWSSYANNLEIAQELILAGANINAQDVCGHTALFATLWAFKCNIDMIHFLIEQGIDINLQDSKGETFLYYASNLRL